MQQQYRYSLGAKPQMPLHYNYNPCTEGPGFWCSSRANAAQCKSVSFCKDAFLRRV